MNLGMDGDEIADVFDSWDAEGGLVSLPHHSLYH
jgi:hypothetical protein